MNGFLFFLFLIWRLILFFFAQLGSLILPFQPRFPYADIFLLPSRLPSFIWSFANLDGVHYLTIAQRGYSAQFTQVFFPLYPLILALFQKILFFLNPLATALTVSNLLFIISLA